MSSMFLDSLETGSFATERPAASAAHSIRLVSWNIDRGSRLVEITDFLRSTNADVICLQEADRNARRTAHCHVAAEIARELRMNYVFGVEFEELAQGNAESPAFHGQATLSVFPLTDSRILRFRNQSRFWDPRWWVPRMAVFQRRLGARIALLSHVRIGQRSLAVYNIHLESRSDAVRRAQLSELLQDVHQYDGNTPVFLAGDFNLDVAEPVTSSLITEMRLQNPFKSEGLRTTAPDLLGRSAAIDWILLQGPISPATAVVHSSISASDHFPLSLSLRLL